MSKRRKLKPLNCSQVFLCDDVRKLIFSFLSIFDLIPFCVVSKNWNCIIRDEVESRIEERQETIEGFLVKSISFRKSLYDVRLNYKQSENVHLVERLNEVLNRYEDTKEVEELKEIGRMMKTNIERLKMNDYFHKFAEIAANLEYIEQCEVCRSSVKTLEDVLRFKLKNKIMHCCGTKVRYCCRYALNSYVGECFSTTRCHKNYICKSCLVECSGCENKLCGNHLRKCMLCDNELCSIHFFDCVQCGQPMIYCIDCITSNFIRDCTTCGMYWFDDVLLNKYQWSFKCTTIYSYREVLDGQDIEFVDEEDELLNQEFI